MDALKLTRQRQIVRARHRFATSQGGITEQESIVVTLEHDGVIGRGDAVPSALYGQSLEASEAALDAMTTRLGEDPFAVETLVARFIEACDGQRAAIAAVDSALHDWIGRRLGLAVWKLLGLERPRIRTTFTIGVAELDEIREKVDEALAAGYEALKVKVGVEQDHDVLALIRERFDGPLFLDANQAWEPGEAAEKIRALARFRPTIIEQPLRMEQWRHMAELRELGVTPIVADESCQRPADVVRLHGFVDGVNIKFTKCGGIREALRMIVLAKALNMRTMLGCFLSSSLAIAPALAIATLVDFADLDGHLLLADDPYRGLTRAGGMIAVADTPGLGVEPRDADPFPPSPCNVA